MENKNRIRFYWLWGILGILVVALVTGAVLWYFGGKEPEAEAAAETTQPNDLVCLQFSRYSGAFVEDGTDETVQNVAAILVNNAGSQFLDLATVTYEVGDRIAKFVITGLPPGETAWVLEANRMTLADGEEFRFVKCDSSFREEAITQTDLLEVTPQGDSLTVTNTSDQTLENVCVYYKVYHADGNYLGGITYLLDFGNLPPGQTVQKRSSHFGPQAHIVRYSYQPG